MIVLESYSISKLLKDSNAASKASEGLVASFKLLYLLIFSTISNGLVGMTESSASVFVEVSLCNSSETYSAFTKLPFKENKDTKKIIKDIGLKRLLTKKVFILFDFKII